MSDNEEQLEMEQEDAKNPIADLVQAALDKDYNKANEIFGQAISVKLDDVMDQERIKIAGQIYNGEEPEDEDIADEDLEADEMETHEEDGEAEADPEEDEEESNESAD